MTLGLIIILLVVILLGEPLYVLIGGVAGFLLLASGEVSEFDGLITIVEMTRKLSDNEVLLAIPFFVISGAIMSEGDIARRLIAAAKALLSAVPGGLAVSTVLACIFFAAISGSSPVTVIAIGSIMFPALVKEGYPDRFSSGLVTSAGSLGILIPPSIPMIVYAIIDPMELDDPPSYQIAAEGEGLDLVDLFLAGLGPGLLIGILLAGYSIIIGKSSGAPVRRFDIREVIDSFTRGIWSLLLPVIILGGIYAGIFTPTQAAAVSVVYALVVELYIHRSLTFRDLPRVLSESTVLIGSLLIIIALAQGFNEYLELAQVAERAVDQLLEWELSPLAFLLLVNLLLLVVGAFMDILSAILILVPLLSPIAFQLGIHPIHLAVIFIVNLEIGYLTPPLGLNLFVASTIFRKSLGEVVKSVIPFIGLMLVGLVMITYIPAISIGPVAAFNGQNPMVGFPERQYSMKTLEFEDSRQQEAISFLAGIAEREMGMAEDMIECPPVIEEGMALAEIMELNNLCNEQESMNMLAYDTVDELLSDYRLVYSGRVRLRDLSIYIEERMAQEEEESEE